MHAIQPGPEPSSLSICMHFSPADATGPSATKTGGRNRFSVCGRPLLLCTLNSWDKTFSRDRAHCVGWRCTKRSRGKRVARRNGVVNALDRWIDGWMGLKWVEWNGRGQEDNIHILKKKLLKKKEEEEPVRTYLLGGRRWATLLLLKDEFFLVVV